MSSAVDELRQDKFDELIQFYYYELKDLLVRLDYDMKKFPSLRAFQLQIQKKSFNGKFATFLESPEIDNSFQLLRRVFWCFLL